MSEEARFDFQLPTDEHKEVTRIADALRRVIDESEEVRIVSPYLTRNVLEPLTRGRRFRLVTDMEECFRAKRDERLLEFLAQHRGSVRDLPRLHAKVVLGAAAGLLGSANLTESALTRKSEVTCTLYGPPFREMERWFELLWDEAEPLEDTVLEACRALCLQAPEASASSAAASSRGKSPSRTGSLGWLGAAPQASSPRPVACEATLTELVEVLGKLCEDRKAGELILELMAFALRRSGFSVEDPRLHLNFGRGNPLSITLGQRYIIWITRTKGVVELALMLRSAETAQRAVAAISGAWSGEFTRGKEVDVYSLHIPLRALPSLDASSPPYWIAALMDWEEAIQAQASACTPSSFRHYKRSELYPLLHDDALRERVKRRAWGAAWWFGVNNHPTSGHMQLSSLDALFEGGVLRWPIGHSKTLPARAYAQMTPGDPVLLWTGDGKNPAWGVLGVAVVRESHPDHVTLHEGVRFPAPLTPYPQRLPAETEVVRLLFKVFGDDFRPLGDIRRAVYQGRRTPPCTVARITLDQWEELRRLATPPGP